MITATARTDSQLKSDVLNELKWDSRVDETDVGVQVHSGVVTLAGNVNAYAKKVAARDAAHRVMGVLDVVDDMHVKPSSLWERTDEDIAHAVRTALKWDVFVPDDKITSTVSAGAVTLQGNVDSWTQRNDASRAVQRLAGVRSVVNQLSVNVKAVSPDRIKQDIEDALERQADREAKRIGVTVRDGVVTLTGTVRSWGERNAIDRVAGFAPGVRSVTDHLTVDPYIGCLPMTPPRTDLVAASHRCAA